MVGGSSIKLTGVLVTRREKVLLAGHNTRPQEARAGTGRSAAQVHSRSGTAPSRDVGHARGGIRVEGGDHGIDI